MNKIEKLTPEQEAQLVVYRERYFAIGSCTEPADRPRAEAAVKALYRMLNQAEPIIEWYMSPFEVQTKMNVSASNDGMPCQEQAYWVAYYNYCQEILGIEYAPEDKEKLAVWTDLASSCGWIFPYDEKCYMCERPLSIVWETDRSPPRLHNPKGPAVEMRDGTKLYIIRGMDVEERIIEHPETITIAEIEKQSNAELRRVLIQQYGEGRYLTDAGARVVDDDPRFGTLLEIERPGDEPLARVRVVNKTAEPDGTFNVYFLKVPPGMKTAHEAVAWTFDMSPEQYQPTGES